MYANLEVLVSAPRFAKYLGHCGNDAQLAHELYAFNLKLASASFKAIQMCEVIVRNSMDRELRNWNAAANGHADWAINPAPMLRACFYDDGEELREARRKAESAVGKRRAVTHDDVVAQLGFGAWRYLLPPKRPHRAKQAIWDDALVRAFPNRNPGTSVDALARGLGFAYDFRNRVAHHEPIYHLDLTTKRRVMLDSVDAVSRDAKKWFVSHDELGALAQEFQRFCRANKLTFS